MESDAVTRAPAEGLKFSGLAGRSILLKAGSPETRGAYSILKFTAPPGSPWSTHHVHAATEAWYVLNRGVDVSAWRDHSARASGRTPLTILGRL